MRSLSREEVRAVDGCAIEHFGAAGIVLMENAGRGATDAIEAFVGGICGKKVAVLCGAGNNGGDGCVVGRQAALRGATGSTILVFGDGKITGDARTNLDILRAFGHDVRCMADESAAELGERLAEFDVIVDAIGGTGIVGELRGAATDAVAAINIARARGGAVVVAMDIPTGLDCDTGVVAGPVVMADLTVTFVARKKGFDVDSAHACLGEVVVVDIGIDAEQVLAKLPALAYRVARLEEGSFREAGERV